MELTPEEINLLALTIAKCLTENKDKKEIVQLKYLLSLIISNLNSYL